MSGANNISGIDEFAGLQINHGFCPDRAWLLFPGRIISIFLILIENHPLKLIALPDLGNPALKGKI
jgi:hypothetical protein